MGGGASKELEERNKKLQEDIAKIQEVASRLEADKTAKDKEIESQRVHAAELQRQLVAAKEQLETSAGKQLSRPPAAELDDEHRCGSQEEVLAQAKDTTEEHQGGSKLAQEQLRALAQERDALRAETFAALSEAEMARAEAEKTQKEISKALVEHTKLKDLLPVSGGPEDPKGSELRCMEERAKELKRILHDLELQKAQVRIQGEEYKSQLRSALEEVGAREAAQGMLAEETDAEAEKQLLRQAETLIQKHASEGGSKAETAKAVEAQAENKAERKPGEETDEMSPGAQEAGVAKGASPASDAVAQAVPKLRHPSQLVAFLRDALTEVQTREKHLMERVEVIHDEVADVDSKLMEFAPDAPGRVPNPRQRAVLLGSLLEFFQAEVGEVSFEEEDSWRLPLCMPTKLAKKCHQANQENQLDISRNKVMPLSPNFIALEKLLIRPLTQAKRCSMAELWNSGKPRSAEVFVSHSWEEDVGVFVQGLMRLAVSQLENAVPALPAARAAASARVMPLFIHAFSDSLWCFPSADNSLQDLPVYQVLKDSRAKLFVLSLGQDAGCLLRSWCNVELFLAQEFGKDISLLSKLGPLQDCSGHESEKLVSTLVEVVLPEVDFEKSQAFFEEEKMLLSSYLGCFTSSDVAQGQGEAALKQNIGRLVSTRCIALLAQQGNAPMMKSALEFGADPNIKDAFGVHPLTYASALHGDEGEIAKLLTSWNASPLAKEGAKLVLELFSENEAVRLEAIASIQRLPLSACTMHASAVEASKRKHARQLVHQRFDDLNHESAAIRISALKDFVDIGILSKPILQEVKVLMIDTDSKVVELACRVLGNCGELVSFIDDPNPLVRAAALKHVVQGGSLAQEHAKKAAVYIKDADLQVRHAAVQAMIKLGGSAAPYIQALAEALHDEHWNVRLDALRALEKLGNSAVPYLGAIAGCLGDDSPEVRKKASEILSRVKFEPIKETSPGATAKTEALVA
eukprot:TRINITY_DN27262_c0_g1_i1.p1 TRINITY_DN27262_c0_g1~~TRINITY_DN27262_c0_g1_i1.p1  ORF type:complete len:974 (-),score=254.27 TRINITY_DN27262_c0_g1_i1:167-3088(-)